MKIGQKLILGFMIVAMIVGVFGYFAIVVIKKAGDDFLYSEKIALPSLVASIEIEAAIRQASIKAVEYCLRHEEIDKQKTFEALKKLNTHFNILQKFTDREESIKGNISDEKARIELIAKNINKFIANIKEYISLKDQNLAIDSLFIEEDEIHNVRKGLIHLLYEQKNHDNSSTGV